MTIPGTGFFVPATGREVKAKKKRRGKKNKARAAELHLPSDFFDDEVTICKVVLTDTEVADAAKGNGEASARAHYVPEPSLCRSCSPMPASPANWYLQDTDTFFGRSLSCSNLSSDGTQYSGSAVESGKPSSGASTPRCPPLQVTNLSTAASPRHPRSPLCNSMDASFVAGSTSACLPKGGGHLSPIGHSPLSVCGLMREERQSVVLDQRCHLRGLDDIGGVTPSECNSPLHRRPYTNRAFPPDPAIGRWLEVEKMPAAYAFSWQQLDSDIGSVSSVTDGPQGDDSDSFSGEACDHPVVCSLIRHLSGLSVLPMKAQAIVTVGSNRYELTVPLDLQTAGVSALLKQIGGQLLDIGAFGPSDWNALEGRMAMAMYAQPMSCDNGVCPGPAVAAMLTPGTKLHSYLPESLQAGSLQLEVFPSSSNAISNFEKLIHVPVGMLSAVAQVLARSGINVESEFDLVTIMSEDYDICQRDCRVHLAADMQGTESLIVHGHHAQTICHRTALVARQSNTIRLLQPWTVVSCV